MAEAPPNGITPVKAKKKTSPAVAALVLVVALGLFAAAFVYAGGMDYVTGLLGGTPTNTTEQPTTPSTPSTPTTTTTEPTQSVEPTAPAGPEGYALDPAAKARMFNEQVASRETLTELADGKFASITMGTPAVSGADARVPVTATYKAGGSFSGTLLLKKYENAWYFAAIARGGNSLSVKPASVGVDTGVVDTIVADQRANQELISEIVSGQYSGLTLGAPEGGAGTKSIPVTMATGSGSESGRIVLVSAKAGGKTYWFVTSFKK